MINPLIDEIQRLRAELDRSRDTMADEIDVLESEHDVLEAELLRYQQAEEIQMRRGWMVAPVDGYFASIKDTEYGTRWCVPNIHWPNAVPYWPDPKTALIEADKWIREQEARKP